MMELKETPTPLETKTLVHNFVFIVSLVCKILYSIFVLHSAHQ